MKNLLAYCTKHGCTHDAAKLLAKQLPGDTELVNLAERQPDPNDYDVVILGAPVYAGTLPRDLRAYCRTNEEILLEKRLGFFVCCSEPSPKELEYLKANLPRRLIEMAVTASFGGEYRADRMNFFEKMVLKAATKASGGIKPALDSQAIENFAVAVVGAID